jgi:hypothetical protein
MRMPTQFLICGLVLKALLSVSWRFSQAPEVLALLTNYDPVALWFAEKGAGLFLIRAGSPLALVRRCYLDCYLWLYLGSNVWSSGLPRKRFSEGGSGAGGCPASKTANPQTTAARIAINHGFK